MIISTVDDTGMPDQRNVAMLVQYNYFFYLLFKINVFFLSRLN